MDRSQLEVGYLVIATNPPLEQHLNLTMVEVCLEVETTSSRILEEVSLVINRSPTIQEEVVSLGLPTSQHLARQTQEEAYLVTTTTSSRTMVVEECLELITTTKQIGLQETQVEEESSETAISSRTIQEVVESLETTTITVEGLARRQEAYLDLEEEQLPLPLEEATLLAVETKPITLILLREDSNTISRMEEPQL